MIENLIICLIITVIIEVSVAFLLNIRSKEDIRLIVLINLCTNPVVVYILNIISILYNKEIYLSGLLILEISVFVVEAMLLKKYMNYKKVSPFKLSLYLNLASFGFGILINLFVEGFR